MCNLGPSEKMNILHKGSDITEGRGSNRGADKGLMFSTTKIKTMQINSSAKKSDEFGGRNSQYI
jgi:hypothetical protein